MKIFLSLLITLLTSLSAQAMTELEARHLLSRTGFNANFEEIQALQGSDYTEAVSTLLANTTTTANSTSPEWLSEPFPNRKKLKSLSQEERKEFRRAKQKQVVGLKSWWYQEMIATDSPLTERMTLFWHNHFTSSVKKVKSAKLLYQQNQLLRQHALGNFSDLLHNIAKDPAMLIYLDNHNNVKRQANENFARELLELFTLGEGNYTEADIKAAARAFTGWSINRNDGTYLFRQAKHDNGIKTFMGQTGNFNGDDIINIILQQPEVAIHVVKKFWYAFVSNTITNDETIYALADTFRNNNYEIKPLLNELLTSNEFRDANNYGNLIKSPVELIVGTVRQFNIPIKEGRLLTMLGRALEQDIFNPPNVKGWPGGKTWITSSTLLIRQQFLSRLLQADGSASNKASSKLTKRMDNMVNVEKKLNQFSTPLSSEQIQTVLVAVEPINEIEHGLAKNELVEQLVLDPVYQLK